MDELTFIGKKTSANINANKAGMEKKARPIDQTPVIFEIMGANHALVLLLP